MCLYFVLGTEACCLLHPPSSTLYRGTCMLLQVYMYTSVYASHVLPSCLASASRASCMFVLRCQAALRAVD